jgi:hypothetical protein
MDKAELKRKIPTFIGYWEKRQLAARNRLPKHLRPPARWPIVVQMALNIAILITLSTLMMNKDEYVTDAGPAITVIEGFQMKNRYINTRGARLAKFNFWLMALAFISWPMAVAVFLP